MRISPPTRHHCVCSDKGLPHNCNALFSELQTEIIQNFKITKLNCSIFSSVRASDAGRYECQVSMSKKLSMFVELTVLGNVNTTTISNPLITMFQWRNWRWRVPDRSSPRAGPWCSWCAACTTSRGRGRSSGNIYTFQMYKNLYPP